jgi:hypothetical protein
VRDTFPRARRRKSLSRTDASDGGSAPAPARPSLFGIAKDTVALATAVFALVVSGVFAVWPSLKPDPKEKVGATLVTLELDRAVSRDQYYERFPEQRKKGGDLATEGNVFYVRAKIEGFKRETLHLRWFTYDKTNRNRVRGYGSTRPLEDVFKPQAPVNTQIGEVWVPIPPDTGDYFVRFELWASGNVLLAYSDSPVFHVESL